MPTNFGGGSGGSENGSGDEEKSLLEAENEVSERGEADEAPVFGGEKMAVAPNPTNGSARVFLNFSEDKTIEIALLDAFGKRLATEKAEFAEGSFELDLSALPAGVYFVRASAGERVWTKRLMKN